VTRVSGRSATLAALALVLAGPLARCASATGAQAPAGAAAARAPIAGAGEPSRADLGASIGETPAPSDEGALDNDSEIPANAAAAAQLQIGDRLREKLGAAASDPAAWTAVFEAWRAALVQSSANDLVLEDGARLALSVEAAVEMRLFALSADAVRAFSARFSGLADAELAAAEFDPAALARVEHGFPFTRAAVIAALRQADLAFEQGDAASARSAVERAARDASNGRIPDVDAGITARRATFAPRADSRGAGAPTARDACVRLKTPREVALPDDDVTESMRRHLEPSLAFDEAGNAWIQAGELLHRLDAELGLSSLAPMSLLASRGLSWLPAFGEKSYDWIQRPAVSGTTLVLVCGRTHESRDNALVALDVSAGIASRAKLAWAYTDAGFASAGGPTLSVADVLLPGRLEFQPGPVFVGGHLCAAVRQWFAKDSPGGRQRVDEASTVVWLVAFDVRTGLPDWKREIARGSDLRGRRRDRFTEPRGLSQPAAPLATAGDRIFVDTELGVASLVDAGDGRAIWSVRSARTGSASDERRPSGTIAFSSTRPGGRPAAWSWAPADAGGVLYTISADPAGPEMTGSAVQGGLLSPPPRRISGLAALLGASGASTLLLAESEGRSQVLQLDPRTLAQRTALPFGRGERVHALLSTEHRILCASGGTLALFDTQRDLYRLDERRIDELAEETALSLHQDGRRVYLVGPKKVWIFAVE
jgi:hypothetical protein